MAYFGWPEGITTMPSTSRAPVGRFSTALRSSTSNPPAQNCRRVLALIRERCWLQPASARMLMHSATPDQGHTLLREIYNWLAGGFDLADLKDGKALLDELEA